MIAVIVRLLEPCLFGLTRSAKSDCKKRPRKSVESVIDPLFPVEQEEFLRGKSSMNHAVLLTQNIEDCFEMKRKTGAVFVDLRSAYDTVCHRGLTYKLFRPLPDKHMIRIIMEFVQNKTCTLTNGSGKQTLLNTKHLYHAVLAWVRLRTDIASPSPSPSH